MKTNHIALTLLASAALMLSACVNEKNFDNPSFEKNELALRIGAVKTRAAAEADVTGTFTVASFRTGDGGVVTLEETVESLDAGLATRGTPAFTENVLDLYETFNAVAPNKVNGSTTLPDATFQFDGTTWWTHHYAGMGEMFPDDENRSYQLFMRMPGDIAKNKYGLTSDLTYNTNGSIEFDYTSPNKATDQTDILFTSKTIEENQESILFYHVLTGIKFQNFFTNKENGETTIAKTNIKKVQIEGVKKSGHCTVTPGPTAEGSSATVSLWTNVKDTASFSISVAGLEKDTTNYTGGQYGLESLLNTTASARNINDPDGSLTFWFIPQKFTAADSVKIKVDFDIQHVDKNGTAVGEAKDTSLIVLIGAREWKAGELHTFTLKPTVVGVELVDEMDEAKLVKSNVEVENTGNVWEYVRVNLVANWVGNVQTSEGVYDTEDDSILMGYKNDAKDTDGNYVSNEMVEAWNDKDNDVRGYYLDKNKQKIDPLYTVNGVNYLMYGKFEGLTPESHQVPASADSTVNGWVRYDKYYYFTRPIGPSETVSEDLFESYTVNVSPEFWIPDQWGVRRKAGNVHLVMDLMVQAIPAPVDQDGNVLDNGDNQGYIRAWVKALGKTQPADLLDL